MDRMVVRDDQWERIAPLVPGKVGDPGRSGTNNRRFVEAVLWIARVGAPWRDLPEGYGNWKYEGQKSGQSQRVDYAGETSRTNTLPSQVVLYNAKVVQNFQENSEPNTWRNYRKSVSSQPILFSTCRRSQQPIANLPYMSAC